MFIIDQRLNPMTQKNYKNLQEFYPYYLTQHLHPICQRLHVFGTLVGVILGLGWIWQGKWWMVFIALSITYSLAWIGHFVFEKNTPATFKYPVMSFVCDFKMLKDFFSGELEEKIKRAQALQR